MKYRGELVANGVITPIIGTVNNQAVKMSGQTYRGSRPKQIVRDIISRTSIRLDHHAVFVINEDGDVWQYVGRTNANGQSVGRIEKLDILLSKAYVEQILSGAVPIVSIVNRLRR